MVNAILGKKGEQSQKFLEDGTRVPVTQIFVPTNWILNIKDKKKVQVGIGVKKRPLKSISGQAKKAGLKDVPEFVRELDLENQGELKAGDGVKAQDVLIPGDIVDTQGTSKGKGYAGVVKRHHFKGGPRTHGQSDRERAPGSIGQTTTPGRVYKGKRMAGRMGNEQVTVKNLEVLDVLDDSILIKGLVPGITNSLVIVKKKGKNKKFIPFYKEETKESIETKGTEEPKGIKAEQVQGEVKAEEQITSEKNEIKQEVKEEK